MPAGFVRALLTVPREQTLGEWLHHIECSINRDQSWKYIQDNWEKVQAQFTTAMGAALVGSTSGFCSVESRASVESFFSTHKVAAADVALKHALERIDGCIEFRKLQEPNLKQWLAAQPKP